jgi:hypothetical protein
MELAEIRADGATHYINNDYYKRSGSCNQCGDCCPGCPHLIKNRDGTTTCGIWEKLSDKDDAEALKVGIHTSACKKYPNSPVDINISNRCAYNFEKIK